MVLPQWAVLPLYILIPATAVVVIHMAFRRFVSPDGLKEHHDVAGYLVAVVGVLYSVVLGFLVGTVWTGFDAAQNTSDTEAGYIADTLGFARSLPQPQGAQLTHLLARYAVRVDDVEFPALARGQRDPAAGELIDRAIQTIRSVAPPPANARNGEVLQEASIYNSAVDSLRKAADTRRLRLVEAQSRLPWAMYQALILGGLMVIAFVFFFAVRSFLAQVLMTALVAGSIGLFFGLITQLSTPYSGMIRVTPEAWTYIIDVNHLREIAK
ncbi:MAG: hypothetical protein ABI282_08225 [Candidatus Baltobacteraceae bacterium]